VQQELERTHASPFFLQDSYDILVGVAGMDGERQAGQRRRPHMGAETGLLHRARRLVVEIVQAGLADADAAPVPRQLGDRFCFRNRKFGGVVRVSSDRAPDLGWASAMANTWSERVSLVPMVTTSPTPAAAARANTASTSSAP